MSRLDGLREKSVELLTHPYADYVKNLLTEQVGPRIITLAQDDKKMRKTFKFIYRFLPLPVRLIVRRDKFVDFCMRHKEALMGTHLNQDDKSTDIK